MGKRVNTAVWLEKQHRWQIKVQKDGQRRTFTSSKPGRTGQREANAKADAWLDDGIDSGNLRVNALFGDYIEALKLNTGKAHWTKEESIGRAWIMPEIGHMKIEKISEMHLQKILDKAANSSKKDSARGLSKKSLMNIRATIDVYKRQCGALRKRLLPTCRRRSAGSPRSNPPICSCFWLTARIRPDI